MSRYREIDFFRGLMLVIMTINHIGCGLLRSVTYQPLGYVTAAEGFVFLSGLTVGVLYRMNPRARERFLSYNWAWKRVRLIYLYYAGACVVLFGALFLVPGTSEHWCYIAPLFQEHPAEASLFGVIMLNQPMYLNILPLYFGLTLCTPLVLRQIEFRRIRTAAAVSILLWLLAQVALHKGMLFRVLNSDTLNIGMFNILAWQLLYIAGIVIGAFRDRLKMSGIFSDRRLLTAALFVALFFFLHRHQLIHMRIYFIGYLIKIPTLGLFRILNFFALFYVAAVFKRPLGPLFRIRFLELLGRNSLQVFTAHFFILLGLQPVKYTIKTMGAAGEIGFTALAVGLLGMVAFVYERYKKMNTQQEAGAPE